MSLARYVSKLAALLGSDGKIPAAGIADGAITSAKIADGTIVAGDIADSAITTAKLNAAAVTAAKLASGAAASNLGFTPPNFAPVSSLALVGGYANGTWYPIWDSSTLSASGMYIIDFYAATYTAGGGMYAVSGVSVPFHFYAGGTNSADIQPIAVHQTGHALGGNSIALRTRTTYNNVGVTYIEMQYNGASLSGMNASISGKECVLYVRRLY